MIFVWGSLQLAKIGVFWRSWFYLARLSPAIFLPTPMEPPATWYNAIAISPLGTRNSIRDGGEGETQDVSMKQVRSLKVLPDLMI